MKLNFLGTCSGTEPMKDMHHTSWIFEHDGDLYWFDMGENASYRAYLSGFDFSRIRAVFISHPHIDHTGGLPHFLFTVEKLGWREKLRVGEDNTLNFYLPKKNVLDGAKLLVGACNPSYKFRFGINETRISDGVIFDDGKVRITAQHNAHLGEDGSDGWHSYSFLIECEGKRIVYSGDVKSILELDVLVQNGCDVLIMETGHHPVTDVCDYALSHGVKRLLFNHHGREILERRESALAIIEEKKVNATLCYDGMVEET